MNGIKNQNNLLNIYAMDLVLGNRSVVKLIRVND
jgi:hypothetical protein